MRVELNRWFHGRPVTSSLLFSLLSHSSHSSYPLGNQLSTLRPPVFLLLFFSVTTSSSHTLQFYNLLLFLVSDPNILAC